MWVYSCASMHVASHKQYLVTCGAMLNIAVASNGDVFLETRGQNESDQTTGWVKGQVIRVQQYNRLLAWAQACG